MWNSILPQEKVEIEKSILIKEIREEDDVVLNTTFKTLATTLYNSHPYGFPLHGKKETVSSIARNNVLEKFKNISGAITVAVVGNLDIQHVMRVVEDKLIPPSETQAHVEDYSVPKIPDKEKKVIEHRESEAAWITAGYIAPHICRQGFFGYESYRFHTGGRNETRDYLWKSGKREDWLIRWVQPMPHGKMTGQFVIYLGTGPQNLDSALNLCNGGS